MDAVEGSALSVAVRVTNTCVSGMCSVPPLVEPAKGKVSAMSLILGRDVNSLGTRLGLEQLGRRGLGWCCEKWSLLLCPLTNTMKLYSDRVSTVFCGTL